MYKRAITLTIGLAVIIAITAFAPLALARLQANQSLRATAGGAENRAILQSYPTPPPPDRLVYVPFVSRGEVPIPYLVYMPLVFR